MAEVQTRAEPDAGQSAPGSVVVDIGDAFGALVVRTDRVPVGSEIEIRPTGAPWSGAHTAVRERRAEGGTFLAGLFPSLAAGTYEIRWRHDESAGSSRLVRAVEVLAGVVSETTL